MKLPKRQDIPTLEAIWYEKLKQSGFDDIEDLSTSHRRLKSWDSFKCQNIDPNRIEVVKLYFEKATDLLNENNFENWEYREIWKLHCDGLSEREIAVQFPKYPKSTVHWVIRKIRKDIKWKQPS